MPKSWRFVHKNHRSGVKASATPKQCISTQWLHTKMLLIPFAISFVCRDPVYRWFCSTFSTHRSLSQESVGRKGMKVCQSVRSIASKTARYETWRLSLQFSGDLARQLAQCSVRIQHSSPGHKEHLPPRTLLHLFSHFTSLKIMAKFSQVNIEPCSKLNFAPCSYKVGVNDWYSNVFVICAAWLNDWTKFDEILFADGPRRRNWTLDPTETPKWKRCKMLTNKTKNNNTVRCGRTPWWTLCMVPCHFTQGGSPGTFSLTMTKLLVKHFPLASGQGLRAHLVQTAAQSWLRSFCPGRVVCQMAES